MVYSRLNKIERAFNICYYMLENKCSLRDTSKEFNISKSTVRRDIDKIKYIDIDLYKDILYLLEDNYDNRGSITVQKGAIPKKILSDNTIIKLSKEFIHNRDLGIIQIDSLIEKYNITADTFYRYMSINLKNIDKSLYNNVRARFVK